MSTASKRKTAIANAKKLDDAGIQYVTKNDGWHVMINLPNGKAIDFWPSTTKWCYRGDSQRKSLRYGVDELIKEVKSHALQPKKVSSEKAATIDRVARLAGDSSRIHELTLEAKELRDDLRLKQFENDVLARERDAIAEHVNSLVSLIKVKDRSTLSFGLLMLVIGFGCGMVAAGCVWQALSRTW